MLEAAADGDMIVDLTICSAWPAGGTHVAAEDSMKTLLMGSKVIQGGQHYEGRVPPPKKPFFYNLTGTCAS